MIRFHRPVAGLKRSHFAKGGRGIDEGKDERWYKNRERWA